MNTYEKQESFYREQTASYNAMIGIYKRKIYAAQSVSDAYEKLQGERELTGEQLLAWANADQTVCDAKIELRIAQNTAADYTDKMEAAKSRLDAMMESINNGEFDYKRTKLKDYLGKVHVAKIKPHNLNEYIDVLSASTVAITVEDKVEIYHRMNNAVARLATVLNL